MFNALVRVLLFCTCFALIKAEENNTIYMEIKENYDCFIAPSYELIAGQEYSVKLTTPYMLSSSKLRVNNINHHITIPDIIDFHGNMSNDNGVLNLRVVYTFVIDLGHDLNGGWKFSFIFFGGLDTTHKICSKLINIHTKTSCFCKTNVTIKEQTMLHPTAAVSLTPDDDTNPFPIIIAFFGIIVICQTLYIVYIKRQKLVGRYRDISTRPPQPLPLDIYDQVEDQHEQGFTNKAFNIANQRTTPKVARKAPQVPSHLCHCKPLRHETSNIVDDRTAPNVIRKPQIALSMMPLGQAHNVAGKRTAPNVAKTQSQVLLALSSPKDKRLRCLKSTHMNQGSCPRSRPRPRPRPQRRSKTGAPTNMQELITINNRVTWEEDWQYERLAPMQKYL